MKIENRGKWLKEKAKENKSIVSRFYASFPSGTLAQCREVTGLSFPTIAKYRDEFRSEQRNDGGE